jgi:hypothetical protein
MGVEEGVNLTSGVLACKRGHFRAPPMHFQATLEEKRVWKVNNRPKNRAECAQGPLRLLATTETLAVDWP